MSKTKADIFLDPAGHADYREMFAWISIDEHGLSGLCATVGDMGMFPLMGMTREDMEKFEPVVESMRKQTDKHLIMVRYEAVEVVG